MKRFGTSVLHGASVGLGGGSLLLFLYFVLFGTRWPIDIARTATARLALDAALCLAFFAQHSGMIRRSTRQCLARLVPPAFYPAVYSVVSGVALSLLVLAWQPTSDYLFRLPGPLRYVSFAIAALAVAGFTWGVCSLPKFDPFGTQPLQAARRGSSEPPCALAVRGPYRYVRHPLYLFMLLLIWSTPRLSTDQLLFNVLWTVWVVVGSLLEERDLAADFGPSYRQYQAAVPMLLPRLGGVRHA